MTIELISAPSEQDWAGVRQRALITMRGKGRSLPAPPKSEWRKRILAARHSPIRYLRYSFLVCDIPSNVATHYARHVHAQPYIGSLRNDRQNVMDGDKAPRDTPVDMIWDVNAEELMAVINKRLCMQCDLETRMVADMMRQAAIEATPELCGLLVPMCEYHGGVCHEMKPCGRYPTWEETDDEA